MKILSSLPCAAFSWHRAHQPGRSAYRSRAQWQPRGTDRRLRQVITRIRTDSDLLRQAVDGPDGPRTRLRRSGRPG